MYLSELLAALARHRWLVALGLAATIGLSFGAFILVPANQVLNATMLVLPPTTTTEQVGGNAFLALDGLQSSADVLVRAMNSGDVSDSLVPTGSTGTYTVERDTSTSGPVVTVTATDTTTAKANALLDAVLHRMPDEFAALQSTANIPRSATMSLMPLSRDIKATESNKSQIRAVLVAAVGGLVVTVLCTALIDGMILRRRAEANRGARTGATRTKSVRRGPDVRPAPRAQDADKPGPAEDWFWPNGTGQAATARRRPPSSES